MLSTIFLFCIIRTIDNIIILLLITHFKGLYLKIYTENGNGWMNFNARNIAKLRARRREFLFSLSIHPIWFTLQQVTLRHAISACTHALIHRALKFRGPADTLFIDFAKLCVSCVPETVKISQGHVIAKWNLALNSQFFFNRLFLFHLSPSSPSQFLLIHSNLLDFIRSYYRFFSKILPLMRYR